ncbi:metal ABC transporter substrate-binding protein [Lihuaxuella thermophila]|uniref:Zinc transport system substrate-binding protein n=1 Tax=Lihuaxuella thermophila TaxID=1173111 RepID=A0A1H8BRN1_9BACL|nr:metal ABC transporter substrate-binding protein [Lihuaxuella thermophila]SEM84784.1 zinc transport system substrate-binding protein [Lihuaxuella thermophila]
MKKTLLVLAVAALTFSVLFTGCSPAVTGPKTEDGKLEVIASLYPLEDFAKKIGGDHVRVTNLVPPGTEPHDFELSPRDMATLSEADVFIYNGSGFEAWAEKAVESLDPQKTVIVNSTENLELLPASEHEEEHGSSGEHGHEHGNEAVDPHVWLDPTHAKQQALRIRDALIKKDPKHKAEYEKNYAALASQLDQLDREFMEMVKKAPKKEFVVSHAAFGYLANRYGLKQIAISGITPSDEPSPKELQKMIETVRHHQVHVILFETLVNPNVAKVVKDEVNAEALTLNPLEGLTKEEVARGADYFSIMRQNKENLAKALGVAG